jgi:hypothetical protein
MRRHLALAFVLTAANLAFAQQLPTSHPQDTLQGGGGNFSPFGVFSTGSGAEARSQILVPKNELPGPGAVLTGIELLALVGGTVDYASLQITASPTPATSLSSTFAANVVGPTTVVLQATSLQVAHSQTAWVAIPFTQPYVHDGTSALLLDIQKVVQTAPSYTFVTTKITSSPARTDRPQMVYSFGGPGSGQSAATAAFGNAEPISFRLSWLGTPTLRNRGDTGPAGTQYHLGGSVLLTTNGSPGSFWVLAAGTGFLASSVVIPGLGGSLHLDGAVVFAGGLLDATGVGQHTVSIPNVAGLVGAYLPYQAATVDPLNGAIVLTNGSDHFVNP